MNNSAKSLSILFLTTFILMAVAGCQKCYVCESKNTARANFCEGNPNYDRLANGDTIQDAFGVNYNCKLKK